MMPSPPAHLALEALMESRAIVFQYDRTSDHVTATGALEARDLAYWRETDFDRFRKAFVAPDRALLTEALDDRRQQIVIALRLLAGQREGDPDTGPRRVWLNARWTDDARTRLAGVITFAPRATPDVGDGRVGLEIALKRAVDAGDFELWLQPIMALDTEELAGFEGLIRWPHPQRGLLPPDDFLPLAAELGLTGEIGRWVRTTASGLLQGWSHNGLAGLYLSVNLVASELEDARLSQEVASLVASSSVRPGQFRIEVTETEVMQDPDRARLALSALKEAGAGLSMDDFGTGFSSLSRLEGFGFDTLKLDRYFVRTLSTSVASQAIVRSVVGLSRDLGLALVAEGVEDLTSASRLAALGCGYGQGHVFAPPLTQAEARLFVDAARG